MNRKAFGAAVIALVILVLWAVLSTASPAVGQTVPQPDTTSGPRVRLALQPAQQDALKATMREHLAALDAIVSALARQDYDQAAGVAHTELGFPKHHEAMKHEQGFALPAHYQELAMAHHQAAEELARTIAGKQMAPILRQFSKTIRACTACHDAYQL
jgi:4-amino-4-deoxy-L-arabinose transferase-like glycosyltransferase